MPLPFIALIIVAVAGLVATIFYFITLQDTMKLVAPQNRSIQPGQVWLSMIPIFAMVWNFIMVQRISASVTQELNSRGIAVEKRPGYVAGMIMSVLNCLVVPARFLPYELAYIRSLVGLLYLIFFVVYWVQITRYKQTLERVQDVYSGEGLIF